MIPQSLADDNTSPPVRVRYPLAAIPTNYRGCRFRSRLEARWAVFFDHLGIGWQYEPQGYNIGGRAYLPDFLLECGTWVEVKGHEDALDYGLLRTAAIALPQMPAIDERGPRLLILGGHPVRPDVPMPGDYGWLGIDLDGRGDELLFGTYGFGKWDRHKRPWHFGERTGDGPWLRPVFEEWETDTTHAYAAALGARFEHGESGVR
jgi:hypothetical protein